MNVKTNEVNLSGFLLKMVLVLLVCARAQRG